MAQVGPAEAPPLVERISIIDNCVSLYVSIATIDVV
jgi:hypothetical protein